MDGARGRVVTGEGGRLREGEDKRKLSKMGRARSAGKCSKGSNCGADADDIDVEAVGVESEASRNDCLVGVTIFVVIDKDCLFRGVNMLVDGSLEVEATGEAREADN